MPTAQAPYALAIVVCDNIHRDGGTGKLTIMGTFADIAASQFPAVHPLICVYLALTDGRGPAPVIIRLNRVTGDGSDTIAESQVEVDFSDPLMMVELNMAFANVVFPDAGEYRFEVFAGEEYVIGRRITLHRLAGG